MSVDDLDIYISATYNIDREIFHISIIPYISTLTIAEL